MPEFETLANRLDSQIIEIFYLMDLDLDICEIFIGSIQSEGEEHESSQVAQLIDRLFSEIETSEADWFDLCLGGTVDSLGESEIKFNVHDKIHFKLNGITLGQFFTELIYNCLPIEATHEGETSAKISFSIGDDYVFELRGEGNHYTEYIYEGGVEDLERDNYLGSRLDYNMEFSAGLIHRSAFDSEK
jgi:hypothetical protein